MKYFKNQKCKFKYPVITMGTFDGVHLGHQKLLKILSIKAKEKNGEAIVITYFHHPLETIHKKTFPYLLTEKDRKERLLKKYGADCVFYLHFDNKMADMQPENFLEDILINEIKAKEFVVGYDTHFGKERKGDFLFLKENEDKFGYLVDLVEPLKIRNRIISSSLIRDLIREGNMQEAAEFLGRNYSMTGMVIKGHRIGRGIGYPTINLRPFDAHKLIPAIGVYICEILVNSRKFIGVTNIGYSPTLKQISIKEVETYIIDFEGDLYERKVEIVFHKRLREELLFDSKHDLVEAIRHDVEVAKEYFGCLSSPP